ncbi:MAG: Trep_Strep domain-containing protein [Coriobacteriaceae bacterium]|nr:Trep_Strep domain-containing protein [Coriobacteriaceae bacterium]
MVKAASVQRSNKLQGKDFIFIAVFGLLLFIVFFVFAMVLAMNASTFWFTHAIGAIPGGIVWIYLAARVPKPGATVIMSVIVAAVGLLLGMLWTGPAGIVVGGALAEVIMAAGKRSKAAVIAAFAVWTLCFWFGQESMVFLAGSSYVDMVIQSGMSREYGETLVGFMQSPAIVVAGILCVVGPIIGGLLGSKIFNKHFARISA